MTTTLITGVAGQDGVYLAALLRDQGYRVVGMVSSNGAIREDVAAHLGGIELVRGDMRDVASLRAAVAGCTPDEIYNLAGVSSVARSWQEPELTADVNGTGVLRLLQVLREYAEQQGQRPRLLQASSSEMFGAATRSPQDESTPLRPRSPYALSKAMAHEAVAAYREGHGPSPARPSSSTMRVRCAPGRSSPARSAAPWPRSQQVRLTS